MFLQSEVLPWDWWKDVPIKNFRLMYHGKVSLACTTSDTGPCHGVQNFVMCCLILEIYLSLENIFLIIIILRHKAFKK